MKPKIYAHGSYIGTTGYNLHTRDFFRNLDDFAIIKFRNFTVGSTWEGYNLYPHDKEPYIDDLDKKLLYKQILMNSDGTRSDYQIYPHRDKDFHQDVNIILCETNHHVFYDDYVGPKIAYNVWESTHQPDYFFNKLLEFDEMWVPSKWQRDCTIKQGYPSDKIKVVPEGVDTNVFFPDESSIHELTSNGFNFFLAGRWDYRKSTKEIIETFLETFKEHKDVYLIVSVDNPFSNDGLTTTEERLKHYGLDDDKIKVIHFPKREEYIQIIKSCDVFVSCARSEGWNLPLIEAMASGTPSIYSNCSGQLEFAEGCGIPVNILGEEPVSSSNYNHFAESSGNYYVPDFKDLSDKMKYCYNNRELIKKTAISESEYIRENFNWKKVSEVGYKTIIDFLSQYEKNKPSDMNKISLSYLDGPKLEIVGEHKENYFVEFVDGKTNETVFSTTINNNMWTSCSRKYHTDWIVKINGKVYDKFKLENKRVLISFESRSIGDTIAWAPYAVAFSIKNKCKVILSTFHNSWFKGLDAYKDIEFIEPGQSTPCYVVYKIGWFRDEKNGWRNFDLYPEQLNLNPLQKTASDILGLDFKELNLGINYKVQSKPFNSKYITISPESTAGCKEWTYDYWSTLCDMLIKSGYKVVSLTRNPFHINGVQNICNTNWQNVFNVLYHSEFLIGLSSGLAWVNWALGKTTAMIVGFSGDNHEFQKNNIRITNNVCIKCWSDPVLTFDAGDWDWCPVYKGTELQHICQKSISPFLVYDKIQHLLK